MRAPVFLLTLPLSAALAAGAWAADEGPEDAVFYGDDLEDAPADSVTVSEEFGLAPGRRSIDSFLGEFENPYAAPEDTYDGTASESRKYRMEQLEKQ